MTADPRGTHEAVEAPIPRQRDAGVMGYVAELQQFDDSMTATADERGPDSEPAADTAAQGRPAVPNRAPRPRRASAAGRTQAVAGGEAAEPSRGSGGGRGPERHGSPRTGAASGVPKKEGRPPWTRTEVGLAVAFVVVAVVAILGGGYAVLTANRPPTGEVQLPLPPVEAAGEQDPPVTAEPTPDAPRASGPGQGPSPSAAPGGGADPSTADSAAPGGGASPTVGASPAAADLFARYSRAENTGLLGLTGYRGEVTISNRGLGAADGWTVTLSLPAGQKVDGVVGADARQAGELVTFTPLAGRGEVAVGGSVSFTFDVPGLLAGEPTGCAINGRPCE
ncbi:cellulose binding domain-containing protein [Phytohabitans houttuyneae]|uniref:CBM2 domain-containing protein n=1 Tax=Phytohabitans houttuyneae TaxID=1076126 RepID=A0A6V8KUV4_9ACTN|nr:cellulose binding domain-containing protein [Phytohabitans houttuyneae]GFJ86039.1 hypothetical protein Phou_102190 [Phytohabitans houttuyneae]